MSKPGFPSGAALVFGGSGGIGQHIAKAFGNAGSDVAVVYRTKKDVAETVDCFLNAVAKALSDGHHIEIRGFGTFRVKDRKSRIARNPRTGEAVPVPPRRVPVFKVSKELKDMVSQQ